jgi:hypothetical protein
MPACYISERSYIVGETDKMPPHLLSQAGGATIDP